MVKIKKKDREKLNEDYVFRERWIFSGIFLGVFVDFGFYFFFFC